jgi:hypothetical protein
MEGTYSGGSAPSHQRPCGLIAAANQLLDEAVGLLAGIGESLAAVERVRVGART